MKPTLRWGIAGTGTIARKFASELPHSLTGTLVAVGSRTAEAADRFASEFGEVRAHGSYEALLADPEVEAVYIASPHPEHAWQTIAAAEAGKHILCEKPAALNHADAMAAIEAARRHNVFFMEAFMYRCHPRTAQIAELIAKGVIGRVRIIEATFSFASTYNPASRLFSNASGGGGIMDVGCYTLSISRLVAGAATGAPVAEPLRLCGSAVLCGTGVDVIACAALEFPGDILAQLSCGVGLRRSNELAVIGEEGILRVGAFWNPPGPIEILAPDGTPRESFAGDPGLYKYAMEADAVAEALPALESPRVSHADTLGNMAALDLWREAVGVRFEDERAESPSRANPVSRSPLRPGRFPEIPTACIEGLDKPVSRLVLGVDHQNAYPHLAAMVDDFVERGGTTFDTGYIYGNGRPECLLGGWIKNRNAREVVTLIVKGAHTPCCDPDNLRAQLATSLERLGTDYADMYLMHRDNLSIPVGEFVDVLDELTSQGAIRLAGVSNWTLARIREANAYAAANGRRPIQAISNNFSLARMVDPVWEGCEAASGEDWRKWLEETRTPLLAWSSQARGYFAITPATGVAPAEIARCWDSEDNRERRRRAGELAERRGVSPMNIALAYVLTQPFPTFALFGPRTIEETRSSLPGLQVELSQEERDWLDLR